MYVMTEFLLIYHFSYAVLKSLKEELEYRNVHLLNVIESERTTRWKLQEFAEEQRKQLESLRKEVHITIKIPPKTIIMYRLTLTALTIF